MPGIEPGAFHMQSERSTTELHPLRRPTFAGTGDLVAIHFRYIKSPGGECAFYVLYYMKYN